MKKYQSIFSGSVNKRSMKEAQQFPIPPGIDLSPLENYVQKVLGLSVAPRFVIEQTARYSMLGDEITNYSDDAGLFGVIFSKVYFVAFLNTLEDKFVGSMSVKYDISEKLGGGSNGNSFLRFDYNYNTGNWNFKLVG